MDKNETILRAMSKQELQKTNGGKTFGLLISVIVDALEGKFIKYV